MSDESPGAKSNTPDASREDTLTPREDTKPREVRLPTWVWLFPTRYALGEKQSEPPKLPGNMRPKGPIIDKEGWTKTRFTLRRPRPGHLYVFVEKQQAVHLFRITKDGQLVVDQSSEMGKKQNDFSAYLDHTPEGFLKVKDDSPIWLAFSDSCWTQRIIDQVKSDAQFRDGHMRQVDPAGHLQSWEGQKHLVSLTKAPKHVAEMKPGMSSRPFWSSYHTYFRPMYIKNKSPKEKEALKKSAVVALEDPAGVAMDLAAMMIARLQNWHKDPDPWFKWWNDKKTKPEEKITLEWSSTTGFAIEALREAIGDQAMNDEIAWHQSQEDRLVKAAGRAGGQLNPRAFGGWIQKNRDDRNTALAAQESGIRAEGWKKYKAKFDFQNHANRMKAYRDDLAAFDQAMIKPLADAHTAWVGSVTFKSHFDHHFDDQDADNGLTFANTIANCYLGVQDKLPCQKALADKLQTGKKAAESLVARAFVLNLKSTWDQLDSLAQPDSLTSRASEMDTVAKSKDLIDQFSKAVGKLDKVAQDTVLSRLLGVFASPLAIAAKSGTPVAVLAAGISTRTPLGVVELVGTVHDLAVATYLRAYTNNYIPKDIRGEGAAVEIARLKKQGANLAAPSRSKIVMPVSTGALPPKIAINTANPELPKFNAEGSASLGILLTILDYAAFCKVSNDVSKAMGCDTAEAIARRRAQAGSMIGSTINTFTLIMKKLPKAWLVEESPEILRLFEGIGVLIGAGAGFYVAYLDAKKGVEAYSGGKCLAFCYFISSGLAFTGAIITLGSAVGYFTAVTGGWGMVLALAAIVVGILIDKIKPTEIEKWIERCCWGKKQDARFGTMYEEQHQLAVACGG